MLEANESTGETEGETEGPLELVEIERVVEDLELTLFTF